MHNTTFQRFEIKYFISEAQANQILHYIEPYVMADDHTKWGEPYIINSMYLDSDAMRLFWSSRTGEKNRLKLRIRSYSDRSDAPVFFEIKRRVDQVILKQRAMMKRDAVELLLNGREVPSDFFLKPTDLERKEFYQFRDTVELLRASPKCMVLYDREAYMSALEEPVRVTFDRNITGLQVDSYDPSVWRQSYDWTPVYTGGVILEVKFTDAFPYWIRKMVDRFQLRRDSYAKYVAVIEALKREGRLYETATTANEDPIWSAAV